MMFCVFVLFYLVSDNAPLWIWALAVSGFAYDMLQERRAARLERVWRQELLGAVRAGW